MCTVRKSSTHTDTAGEGEEEKWKEEEDNDNGVEVLVDHLPMAAGDGNGVKVSVC